MNNTDDISPKAPVSDGLVFAADLGGTHLRAATIDRSGEIHFRLKQSTPTSADDIVRALVQAVRDCEKQSLAARKPIRALSVVVPGAVDVQKGIVVQAPNVPSLDGFHLTAALTNELQLPATLENDANAAAVGEMWQGAGRGRRSIVCVTLGTGVGGGIILDGRLWRGADGAAGEIGHMCVDPFAGIPCGCGSTGCLEVYASATAIVRMARELSARYPVTALHLDSSLTAEKIYKAAVEEDTLALEVFSKMSIYLGIGLANLINVINPEMIVIGGGVSNGWDLFENRMRGEVAERVFASHAARVKIVRAERGDDAGLLGAAWLAIGDGV